MDILERIFKKSARAGLGADGVPTVLLINPPSREFGVTESEEAGVCNALRYQSYPPMNLIFLATYVMQERPGVRVIIKDFIVDEYSNEILEQVLSKEKPFLVGLTSFSTALFDLFSVARQVKSIIPEIPIIIGGPHAALFPEETVGQNFIDFVCQGEGESALVKVIDRILSGSTCEGIENIWWKRSGVVVQPVVTLKNAFENIDDVPTPDLTLIDLQRYFHPFLYSGRGLITVMTGRGCHFKCTFCNVAGRQSRLKSVDAVIEEIASQVKTHKIRNVFIIDDTFNLNVSRFIEFCQKLDERSLDIHWAFRGRVSEMNEDAVRLGKKVGLKHISFGIEDFTDEGLRKIKKGVTVKKIREVFSLCNRIGVFTTANFIIGLPHNQDVSIFENLNSFIREISPTSVQVSVLLLLPGSELYFQAVKKGIISGGMWRDHALNPNKNFSLPRWEEGLNAGQQAEIRLALNDAFYKRPGYLLARLIEIRSWTELKRKVITGLYLTRWTK